jgi:hypothetical protein
LLATTAQKLADNVRFPGAFCFLQLSAPLRTSASGAVLGAALGDLGLQVVSLGAATLEVTDLFDTNGANFRAVVVEDLHMLLSQSNAAEILDRLRPQISKFRYSGGRLLFISHAPLSAFSDSIGSPLLSDAKEIYPRLESIEDIKWYLTDRMTDDGEKTRVAKFASGSPVLADEFALIAGDHSCSGTKKMSRVRLAEQNVALSAMREIGPSNCAEVEHYVIECGLEVAERAEVPEHFTQLMRQAGLASIQANRLHLLPFVNRSIWCDAAIAVVQEAVHPPPGWSLIAEDLFTIERLLRLALSRIAQSCHGASWRSLLGAFENSIVNLAS